MTDLPFPESYATLQAQFALLEAGVKPAVLVPHWSPEWFAPPGYAIHATPVGAFFFDPRRVVAYTIDRDIAADEIGLLLGYGVARKPAHPLGTLLLAGPDGAEVVAVLVDGATRERAEIALHQLARPGQTVALVPTLQVVRARVAWWTQYFATQTTEVLAHA